MTSIDRWRRVTRYSASYPSSTVAPLHLMLKSISMQKRKRFDAVMVLILIMLLNFVYMVIK